MVDPTRQGMGIGGQLYAARRDCAAITDSRAPCRRNSYVNRVEQGALHDATLSFQLRHGFRVIAVVSGYLGHDPESLGYAAVIEWLNPEAPENLEQMTD